MKKNYLNCNPCPAVFKRISAASFFVVLFHFSVSAQTTNISGIVNTYHRVVEIIPSKACVRVANINGLNVNSRVMLIQMKGASIITTNTSAFGDTTTLNGAGNYEIGTVCYIKGDSVFLFHNLLNTYNTSTGKVQLVQFAEYQSANVVDTVKAASWDSVASTGGVIAIFANQDITMNAPVYAGSSGNSGGAYYNNSGTCGLFQQAGNGYAYDIITSSNLNGAYKGESVANIPTTLNAAKGAPANGGGGGNNHNNSGGGGANLSTGGNGGGNSSSGPSGCNVANNWGRSGKALSSWSGSKIFMGGGGGAGHANNGSASFNYGGNGGGIIFIWANNLIGNNYSIRANGGNGGASQSDGAGGGGAGGTIILHVTIYTGNVSINVNGGNGGLSDDGNVIARCFGGGGGGSGGVVYFTGATPSVTVAISGGSAGAEINRDAGCNAAVPAATGSTGQINSNYIFPRSTDPAGYCVLLLPVKLIKFTATALNRKVLLQWQIDNPADIKSFVIERSVTASQWMELKTIPGNDQKRDYSTIDENPLPGRVYYRVKFIEKNNSLSYSPVRHITTGSNDEFIIYPNPTSTRIIIAGNIKSPADLKLLDITGKIIFQKQILVFPAAISLPVLPAGIYVLNINQSAKKIIIH